MKLYKEYFAGVIALRMLKAKWPDVFEAQKDDPYEVTLGGRLTSGRGGPKLETILKALANEGIILDNYTKTNLNYSFYKRRSDYRWFMTVRKEWFEEFIKTNGVMPEFKIEKTKKVDFYTIKPTEDIDGYRDITRLSSCENIYVLNNLEDFDCIVRVDKRKDIYKGTKDYKSVLIFPRKIRADLSSTVYEGHLEQYLSRHFEWFVEHVLEITPNLINDKPPFDLLTLPANISSKEKWTYEYLLKRLNKIKLSIEYLEKLKDIFENILSKITPDSNLWETGLDAFKKYMEECYPCHLYDEDKFIKRLAEWVMLGKDKGKILNDLP